MRIDLSKHQQKENNLIILTNHFPFGNAEAFLETELPYLTGYFDQVIVLARDVKSSGVRPGNGKFTYDRINPTSNFKEKILTVFLYARHLSVALKYISKELQYLKSQNKNLTTRHIAVLAHDLTKAIITAYHIERFIKKYKITGKLTLYSYWLTSSALALTFVKGKNLMIKKFSRAHGGDIYEYRNALQYLTFREVVVQQLDSVFAISKDGANHLKRNVNPSLHKKIIVSRLGTKRAGNAVETRAGQCLIVSCSYLNEVKRVHLIIESLTLIHEISIRWIHIGDGDLRNTLENLAQRKLSLKDNITYEFIGVLSNTALYSFYLEHYVDLFLNTSSSEGIPVTMMEAQSFGIPIVAPHVGGIPEIVTNENGRLFPVDSPPDKVAQAITEILLLSEEEYNKLRIDAFRNWEERYNADKNFSTFVQQISTL